MSDLMLMSRLMTDAPNPRQREFFRARARHVAYGGARGGGKSWAMRRKFVMLAFRYPGLRLLLLRHTFPELNENHILPLRADLRGIAKYSSGEKAFTFPNGSRVKMGYCDTDADVFQYQGQEYDVIGLEEATLFTEFQRDFLVTCNRTVRNDFTPRMYYTGNPGGVGHAWFKRLFVDRVYRGNEKPEDYLFIQARVYDNTVMMRNNPEYVENLKNLPDGMREAHLDGNWDAFVGQYFTEFRRELHVVRPFPIPGDWLRYFTLDYGLDMLAAYWIAMDTRGGAWVYRELYKPGLRVGEAARAIAEAERGEAIYDRCAPPDLFAKNDQTGRSTVEMFSDCGLYFSRSKNDRVQGWYELKEWLAPRSDEQGAATANLRIFDTCPNLIASLPLLRREEKGDPNDCAREPHSVTHAPDAIRYFVTGRPMAAQKGRAGPAAWEDDQWEDYENAGDADKRKLIERWGDPF